VHFSLKLIALCLCDWEQRDSHNVNEDIFCVCVGVWVWWGGSCTLKSISDLYFLNVPHDSSVFDVHWRSVKWTSWEGDKHHACAPFSRFSWHAPFPKAFSTRYYTFLSPTRADTRALAGPHAELPNRGFNLNPFRNQLIHNAQRAQNKNVHEAICISPKKLV